MRDARKALERWLRRVFGDDLVALTAEDELQPRWVVRATGEAALVVAGVVEMGVFAGWRCLGVALLVK